MRKITVLLCALLGVWAFLLPQLLLLPSDASACPHHSAHDAACGYVPAQSGAACTHLHDAFCYQSFTGEDGAVLQLENCPHVHDGLCGFQPETLESPCQFLCSQCLPDAEVFFVEPGSQAALDEPVALDGDAPFCDCDGNTYEYLDEAIACVSDGIVYLAGDLDHLEIPEGSDFTLDLNGCTLGQLALSSPCDVTLQGLELGGTAARITQSDGALSLGEGAGAGSICLSGGQLILEGPVSGGIAISGTGQLVLHAAAVSGIISLDAECPPIQIPGSLGGNTYQIQAPEEKIFAVGTAPLDPRAFSSAAENLIPALTEDGAGLFLKYSCPHSAPEITLGESSITARCACGEEGSLTLIPPGDEDPEFTCQALGILADADWQIQYPDGSLPTAPDSYEIVLVYGDLRLVYPYTIYCSLTEAGVSIAESAELIYTGQPQTYPHTIPDGVTCTVANATQTNAGTYILTIEGTGCYTGTLEKTYTIQKSSAYALSPEFPESQLLPYGADIQALTQPVFLDPEGAAFPGTLAYASAPERFTEDTKLSYVFTPEDPNYLPRDGQIGLTVAVPDFLVNNDPATAANAVNYKTEALYGTSPLVTLKPLYARYGDAIDSDPSHFQIVWSPEEQALGENTFTVLYSGALGGLSFRQVPVCRDTITLVKGPAQFDTVPTALSLTYNGRLQDLILPGNSGTRTVYYSLSPEDTPSPEIPQGKNAGTYTVYYYIAADQFYNPSPTGMVSVTIRKASVSLPSFQAVSGAMLSSLELPEGFFWHSSLDPEKTPVGNVGQNHFPISYTPADPENFETITRADVVVTVSARQVEPAVALSQELFLYTGSPIVPGITVTLDGEVLPSSAYTLTFADNIQPGTASVTVSCAGSSGYNFPSITKTYTIFSRRLSVTPFSGPLPQTMTGTGYDSAEAVKSALLSRLPEGMTSAFYQLSLEYTLDGQTWQTTWDPACFPAGNLTAVLPFPTGTDADSHAFLAAAMTLAPQPAQGLPAGVFSTPALNCSGQTISLAVPTCAVICLAWEKIPVSYGITLMKDSQGNVQLSAESAFPGTCVTILTQPRWSSYELSALRALSASGETLPLTTYGNGMYAFTMPESEVTVTVSFAPKSDNPKTADPLLPALAVLLLSFLTLPALLLKKPE